MLLRDANRPSAREVRSRTRALLVAIVAAFLVLCLAVPVYVAPQLRNAERIRVRAEERLHALAELRGAALKIRSIASLARYTRVAPPDARIAESAAEIRRLVARIEDDPAASGSAEWRQVSSQHVPELIRIATVSAGVSVGEEASTFRRLVETSEALDSSLQRLSQRDQDAVGDMSARIRDSLALLVVACVAMALVGGVVAVGLVRRELHLVQAFATEKEQRIQDLDAFAGRVAHDLRTPLQTILLGIEALRAAGQPSSTLLSRVERAARRLERLVRELLEFSRHGRGSAGTYESDLSTVVHAVRDELSERAASARVELRMVVRDTSPVAMAETALHSVLANLIENAIKYAADRERRYVEIVSDESGGHVRVKVSDNGVGIAKEKLPRVFDPHFRAAEGGDGYGLGLATVKRLVDAHGGHLDVESTPGVGTTIIATMPSAPRDPVQRAVTG